MNLLTRARAVQGALTRAAQTLGRRPDLAIVGFLYISVLTFAACVAWLYGGTVKDAGWTWQATTSGVVVRSVDAGGPGPVLSKGSRILAVDGDARAASNGPRPWLQTVRPGGTYRVLWETLEGVRHEATLTMGQRRADVDLEMGLCDLVLSLSFAIGGFLVWTAKPNDLAARPYYVAALLTAFFLAGSALGPVSPQLSGAPALVYFALKSIFPFYMAAACAFFARFPTGAMPGKPWRLSLAALWVAGVGAWFFTLPIRLFPILGLEWRLPVLSGLDLATRPELSPVFIKHGYVALCGVFAICVAFYNYRRLTSEAMRLRVRWVIVGATAGIAPGFLCSLTMAVAEATHLIPQGAMRSLLRIYSLATLSLAAIPVAVTYAVLCHRLMGIRVTISNSVQMFATQRFLQVLSLAPAIPAALYFADHRHQALGELLLEPMAWIAAGLPALMLVLRKELLDACDRLLRRLRRAREPAMEDLLETLFDQHSIEDIARTIAERFQLALGVERLVMYCGESDMAAFPRAYATHSVAAPYILSRESALAMLLAERGALFLAAKVLSRLPGQEWEWLAESELVLAAPIAGGLNAELTGVILLGAKASGAGYTAIDLDLVEDAARQIYLAFRMRELEKARDRAMQECQRAEDSGRVRKQFLAEVSHELRNPLQDVMGLTNSLLDTPLRDDQKEYAELIRRSSEWIDAIANDIADLSKVDFATLRLQRMEFEWLPLLEDLTAIAAAQSRGKDVEILLKVEEGASRTMNGDPKRVRQVLLNLLNNSVRYTDHGWILVHARRLYGPGVSHIRITVQDTGPGIPPESRDRLFQPRSQDALAPALTGGTGLGLAISKRLADLMGGDLTFEVPAEGGSRFVFTLPVREANRQPVVEAKPLDGLRLLCIDPLPVSLQATCLTLSNLGAWATGLVARTGQQAVGGVDAIVLATGAPEDAACAIREARKIQPGVPFIVLHRPGQGLPAGELAALGLVEQVRRPAPAPALLGAVQRALAAASDPRDSTSAPIGMME
jgi:signal transduction histidine kinase